MEHGGSCYAPENREEVEKMATEGEILLDKIVAGCNMPAKLEAIRKLDEFHQKEGNASGWKAGSWSPGTL